MNTLLFQQISIAKNSTLMQRNTAILNAIIVLARTYDTAKSIPSKYAKYGYDFSEMIRIKVMNLERHNTNNAWVNTISSLLLKSLDSPKEIINICTQYLREMHQYSTPYVNRKEYANAYK
jgi:hypothetical protein